ncbi:hypothetical protein KFE98_16875 [bacterium SCSIO 12741]|nr:hypothetical protein KFE98_16875 [bacterium SCSIO 12741]
MYQFVFQSGGEFGVSCAVQTHYSFGENHYLFQQDVNSKGWVVLNLNTDGSPGPLLQSGTSALAYDIAFTYEIESNLFLFGIDVGSLHFISPSPWEIRAIHADGKIGAITDHGIWNNTYELQFPFHIDGQHYLYGASITGSDRWFIQPLLPGGKMGKDETDHGNQKTKYLIPLQIPIYLHNNPTQLFRYDDYDGVTRAQDFLPDGKLDPDQYQSPTFGLRFQQIFFANLPDVQAMIGLGGQPDYGCFIYPFTAEGGIGEPIGEGQVGPFDKALYYTIQGRHFVYLFSKDAVEWAVWEIVSQ